MSNIILYYRKFGQIHFEKYLKKSLIEQDRSIEITQC